MTNRHNKFTIELIVAIIANIITTILLFFAGYSLNTFLSLRIPIFAVIIGAAVISTAFLIFLVSKLYQDFQRRYMYLRFLQEDSASKSFDALLDIAHLLIAQVNKRPDKFSLESYVLPQLRMLIKQCRQPMQIVEIDCEHIIERSKRNNSQIPTNEQFIYYLDFIAAYKRMAMPRIVRQAALYMETFGSTEHTDYVIVYGHSTVVVNCVIGGYKLNPFPIIIIEDLQYHARSLGEHKTVAERLTRAGIPFYMINFEQIPQLFDMSSAILTDTFGRKLTLMMKRRFHGFIGCERIDIYGNTLVPAITRGVPSESAHFIQRFDSSYRTHTQVGETIARVVVLAESYKVRNFDKIEDVATHIPLHGRILQRILYLLGIRRTMPTLAPVSLYNIEPSYIYAHINELGIFPNLGGRFDLQYCERVFKGETSLLGFFVQPLFLKFKIFDEVKAILFDLNGVIIDDEDFYYEALSKILETENVRLTIDVYNELCRGQSDLNGYSSLKERFNLSMSVQDMMESVHKLYYSALASSQIKLFSGVDKLLVELKNLGYRIGVVTASAKQEAEVSLRNLNLIEYFETIVSNDDVTEGKPSAQGYLLAAKRLNLPPEQCLVLEDAPENLLNAASSGMKTVGITNSQDVRFKRANFVIDSVCDLLVN